MWKCMILTCARMRFKWLNMWKFPENIFYYPRIKQGRNGFRCARALKLIGREKCIATNIVSFMISYNNTQCARSCKSKKKTRMLNCWKMMETYVAPIELKTVENVLKKMWATWLWKMLRFSYIHNLFIPSSRA